MTGTFLALIHAIENSQLLMMIRYLHFSLENPVFADEVGA